MRISDWSSDVCSSDLYAGLPHARDDELPENGKVWPDLRISGGTLALPGQPQARVDLMIDFERSLLERGGTIVDIGDLGDRRARRTIDASGLYIVPFDPPGTDANGERRTLRSEEHTSELQSLMRPSYAVFCLKKK